MGEGVVRERVYMLPDEHGRRQASFWFFASLSRSSHAQYPRITCGPMARYWCKRPLSPTEWHRPPRFIPYSAAAEHNEHSSGSRSRSVLSERSRQVRGGKNTLTDVV